MKNMDADSGEKNRLKEEVTSNYNIKWDQFYFGGGGGGSMVGGVQK